MEEKAVKAALKMATFWTQKAEMDKLAELVFWLTRSIKHRVINYNQRRELQNGIVYNESKQIPIQMLYMYAPTSSDSDKRNL